MRSLILLALLGACSLSVDRSGTSFQCDPGGECPNGYICVDEVCLPTTPPGCSEQITSGNEHTCALREDGTAWCWGLNGNGQIGDGATLVDHAEPSQVVGLVGVTTIDAGGAFTCASDALTTYCWGFNGQGQLGDASMSDSRAPVMVRSLGASTAVSAGSQHVCSLDLAGTVNCWGDNTSGQLGDGTQTSRGAPAAVPGLPPIKAISAGGAHTCAIDMGGALYCWGANSSGQLGRGTMTPNEKSPMPIANLPGVTAVAAGGSFTCAITGVGLVCFGSASEGVLGNGSTMPALMPVSNAMPVPAISITAGNSHACARDENNGLWCWGRNIEFQLGDTTNTQRSVPVRTILIDVTAVSAGGGHTCTILKEKGIACVGSSTRGQLGDGKKTIVPLPQVVADLAGAKTVAAGSGHSCAQLMTGGVKCWGFNSEGQVGDGSFATRARPVDVVGLTGAKRVIGGSRHTCSELMDGNLTCWGSNSSGQIGDASFNTSSIPRQVFLAGAFSELGLTAGGACTIVGGQARCWGNGQNAPGDASNGLTGLRGFARGNSHACAIESNRSVTCWGNNFNGQLGRGDTIQPMSPTELVPTGITNADKIYAESDGTCVILTDGTVRCWGRNFQGWLGVPAGGNVTSPTQLPGLTGIVQMSLRPNSSTQDEGMCARRNDGAVFCWGSNNVGQIGDGTFVNKSSPVTVLDLNNAVDIAAGDKHTCAAKMDGTVVCWGSDASSQLGDGVKISTDAPAAARMQCP